MFIINESGFRYKQEATNHKKRLYFSRYFVAFEFLDIMPDHTQGPCGLGDRCFAPQFEIRAMYKCCFCGFQLHNPLSGCSRKHGEDNTKVKCVDAILCLHRNSDSGRCAIQPQGSKGGEVQVVTAVVQERSRRMTTIGSKGAGTKPEDRKDLSFRPGEGRRRQNETKKGRYKTCCDEG